MPKIVVNIKWNGKKFENLELDTDESPILFKTQIYSQTGVIPERQKVMVKGGILKDSTDLNELQLKNGHTFMVMGTAGELPKAPPKPIQFLEDLTDAEVKDAMKFPPGLQNLGHTCYMNSTLQCMRVMPELNSSLEQYKGALSSTDSRDSLVASLRDLFMNLSKVSDGFPPLVFWQMLRQTFPQFGQTGRNGEPMQQDAEECWSELVSVLKDKLPKFDSKNFVERYMTGSLESVTTCEEAPEEDKTMGIDFFNKLSCHISINTNYMIHGIMDSMNEIIEKSSPSLNRTAKYKRTNRINRLPQYLPIQFIRFFWKPQERVRAKILRKVKFPLEFDATELCTPELQQKFSKAKLKIKEIEDKKIQREREEKRRKLDGESNQLIDSMEEKTDWKDYLDPELIQDVGCNPTGQYELCAVLTHAGRSVDSGHYISWVKNKKDEWYKFNDDNVSIFHDADIERLDGGGDFHMAYIVLYRAKKLE